MRSVRKTLTTNHAAVQEKIMARVVRTVKEVGLVVVGATAQEQVASAS